MPSLLWAHAVRVLILVSCCNEAVLHPIQALGSERHAKCLVGGTKWWQVGTSIPGYGSNVPNRLHERPAPCVVRLMGNRSLREKTGEEAKRCHKVSRCAVRVRVKVGVKDNQTTNTQVTAIIRDVGLRNYGEFNEPFFCNKAVLWAVDENGWALLACRSV